MNFYLYSPKMVGKWIWRHCKCIWSTKIWYRRHWTKVPSTRKRTLRFWARGLWRHWRAYLGPRWYWFNCSSVWIQSLRDCTVSFWMFRKNASIFESLRHALLIFFKFVIITTCEVDEFSFEAYCFFSFQHDINHVSVRFLFYNCFYCIFLYATFLYH